MQQKRIRVFVVDDSMLFRKLLTDNLSRFPELEIVGSAVDAFDAMRQIPNLRPDVVTLDVEMPKMTGLEFVKQLMPKYPVPVILVSSLNLSVFDALSAGAVDFVRKPDMDKQKVTAFIANLMLKIRIASVAKVRVPATAPAMVAAPVQNGPIRLTNGSLKMNSFIIAIGASTGGTEATLSVLKELPENTPGIVVTQHMPEGFTKMYAERLDRLCKMRVREAKDGDLIERGLVLIAPGNFQMRVVRSGMRHIVRCTKEEKVSGHMPSVDVLFSSMAENVIDGMGVILTGMGMDGAKGMLKMRQKGMYTIGQSRESCVVYSMPMEARKLGATQTEMACERMPAAIVNYLNGVK